MPTFSGDLLPAFDWPRLPARARTVRRLDLDGLTPEDLFSTLRRHRHLLYLDTARLEPGLGHRSYLAFDPILFVRMRGDRGELIDLRTRSPRVTSFREDPFDVVDALQKTWAKRVGPTRRRLDPPGFEGGIAGVFGYDLRRFVERLPRQAPFDDELPDLAIGLYDRVLAYDHTTKQWTSFGSLLSPFGADELIAKSPPQRTKTHVGRIGVSVDRRTFERRVRRIVSRIENGDVYQVNLSRRLHASFEGDAADLYLRLRRTNPAPYAGYFDTGDGHVLSSSPERFLRRVGSVVSTWPIKGTRPRGKNRTDDRRLVRELRASAKDNAELSMIVDLLRNDLHRVAIPGSVAVPRHAFVRSYAAVHHLVSEVTARVPRTLGTAELLRATFPGGSITGAPKIRACEMIDELEPVRRGVYTGSMGWIDRRGDLDLSILIRTLQIRAGRLTLHIGGGIVADSNAAEEYRETADKGRALLEALR